jgi:hypothetical protein
MNNIKKLVLYSLDCAKATGRTSGFNNLKSNKENKIIITNDIEFEADNKEITEIMTLQALNKSTMSIIKGGLFLEGQKGKDKFYSPLLYSEAELIREGDKIKLVCDDEMSVNVGLISSLLENDSEKVENIISQLLEIEQPEKIDFKKVLSGLINLDGFEIKEQNAVILARIPENLAGLISELKTIAELY